ncbi:MAG TPA: hypothetical protein VGU44_00245, partial [Gammaproteobacteria bacterium]|nr:hypothetical protein [Gammaproteobacteria bacterium]
MVCSHTDYLSTFVEVGSIFPLEHVSADDTATSHFTTRLKNFFNFNKFRNRQHTRPVNPGISVGHESVSAGTIGAILTDQNGTHHILSNNHVLADTNQGKKGDKIIQPGSSDGGKEEVAKLEYFVPIVMQCSNNIKNKVDVAIAALNEQSKLNCVVPNIGEVIGINTAHIGMKVEKSGRTTGYTQGNVEAIDADLTVHYKGGQKALFSNQIKTSLMSSPGDSGSLLTSKSNNGSTEAVGLMFAGSRKNSFANHYSDVDSILQGNKYNTRFAKSTVNPSANLNFLYKNRTLMTRGFALSVGIGLATYAYSSIQKRPNRHEGDGSKPKPVTA